MNVNIPMNTDVDKSDAGEMDGRAHWIVAVNRWGKLGTGARDCLHGGRGARTWSVARHNESARASDGHQKALRPTGIPTTQIGLTDLGTPEERSARPLRDHLHARRP